MSTGYRELVEGWNYSEGQEGQSGTRVFVDDPEGVDVLPKVGESFPLDESLFVGRAENTNKCLCRNFEMTKFGGHPGKHIYTYHFSSRVGDDWDITGENAGMDRPKSFELAGELLVVNSKGFWSWESDGVDCEFEGDNAVSLTKRIITGSITFERVDNKLPLEVITNVLGKVNEKAFPIFPPGVGSSPGTWLCSGIVTEEFYNDMGERRWKIHPSFQLRIVEGPTDLYPHSKGWNWVWRPDPDPTKTKWDLPSTKEPTPKFIYESADFGKLFE